MPTSPGEEGGLEEDDEADEDERVQGEGGPTSMAAADGSYSRSQGSTGMVTGLGALLAATLIVACEGAE